MSGHAGAILRAGIGLKVAQLRRATQSYIDDRTDHGKNIVASYAVGAGLFAAAGIFLIAACLVGMTALFRWIEINYGLFPAFGSIGGLLFLIAIICAVVASIKLKGPAAHFPSLGSRLSAALKGSPFKSQAENIKAAASGKLDRPPTRRPNPVEAARSTAADILRAPPSPMPGARRRRREDGYGKPRVVQHSSAALIVTATLLGWALARRRNIAMKATSDVQRAV